MHTDKRENPIKVGDRIWEFDYRLFVDDKKTPLSVTMKKATVAAVRQDSIEPNTTLIDVIFDYNQKLSRGYFCYWINYIREGEDVFDPTRNKEPDVSLL